MNLSRFLFRLFLGQRLPTTQGTLPVAGLQASVRIRRDAWGIPHIEAESEADAYFGVGFCHGQDRAFQLEMLSRVTRGTVAELVGYAAVPVDRLSRRIGFHRAAKAQWTVLDADIQAMLSAYADGVNAGTREGSPSRAHEFVLLGSRPTPWTALDSLAVVKLISFSLSSNWDVELARLKILLTDGPAALAALDPAWPADTPFPAPDGTTLQQSAQRLADDLAAFASVAKVGGGSNNWVVAGSRTASGRPLLANDPHLDATLPSHWYFAHARCPEWELAGATFLGGPSVLAGHNGICAWGLTAGLVDNTDLFREQIGPDGSSVRGPTGWVPCQVIDEVIRIKGAESITEKVVITPRGPIVSPALNVPQGEALSLRAIWLEPRRLRGLLCLHQAKSFAEFRALLADWPASPQNVVYADTTGTIGWQLAGCAPRRRNHNGTLPAAGWHDAGSGWEAETVPFADMPHQADPPVGFLATANNRPENLGAEPYLGVDWVDDYRVSAIRANLAEHSDWDVAGMQQLQTNQEALPWLEIRKVLLTAPVDNEAGSHALALLRDWDGIVAVDSAAAAVFEFFLSGMAERVARARAPGSYEAALGRGDGPLAGYNFFAFRRTGHLVRLLLTRPAGWFANPWPTEIAAALTEAIYKLRALRGLDTRRWRWGRLRTLTLAHPLGRQPRLAPIFNLGPVPCGGDENTINQASVRPLDPLSRPDSIASLRVVIDVGAWDNSRYVLPAGQSGNPLSPHYSDMLPLWQRGEGVPIAWSPAEVEKATRATLVLTCGAPIG